MNWTLVDGETKVSFIKYRRGDRTDYMAVFDKDGELICKMYWHPAVKKIAMLPMVALQRDTLLPLIRFYSMDYFRMRRRAYMAEMKEAQYGN